MSVLNQDVIGQYDIIIIAVKPYQVMEVMKDIHQTFRTVGGHTPKSLRPLVVSVAASVPLQEIEKKASVNVLLGVSSGEGGGGANSGRRDALPSPLERVSQALWRGSPKPFGEGLPSPLERVSQALWRGSPKPFGDALPSPLERVSQALWRGSPKPFGEGLPSPLERAPKPFREGSQAL